MSQIRKIEILYTLSVALLIDIIWSFIIRLMFGKGYDYKLFLILLASAFSIKFIGKKINNKYVSIAIPTIISLVLNFNALYNIIVVAFLTYLVYETRYHNYDFSNIKSINKKSIVFLFVLGLFDMGSNIRLYVIFIIVSIVLQRESRAFSYRMKNSTYGNLVIVVFAILFSVDKIFLQFVNIFRVVVELLWIPISYILLAIIYVISRIFSSIFYILEYITSNHISPNIKIGNDSSKATVSQIYHGINFPPLIKIIVESAIIILILLMIYNLYKIGRASSKDMEGFIEIETEKITDAKKKKKRRYTYGNDIKGKILFMFLKFEVLAKNKGLYKSSMTAKELGSETKVVMNKSNEIDIFVNTYNEVKFSNHVPTIKQYESLKANYKIIKKDK